MYICVRGIKPGKCTVMYMCVRGIMYMCVRGINQESVRSCICVLGIQGCTVM